MIDSDNAFMIKQTAEIEGILTNRTIRESGDFLVRDDSSVERSISSAFEPDPRDASESVASHV